MALIALAVGCGNAELGENLRCQKKASWPGLSRPSMWFGAANDQKRGTRPDSASARPRRNGRAALMARHRRLDLAQRGRAAQLSEEKRRQMLARGEPARPLVAPMFPDQPSKAVQGTSFRTSWRTRFLCRTVLILSCPDESPNSGPSRINAVRSGKHFPYRTAVGLTRHDAVFADASPPQFRTLRAHS
jgi:hypothetical protein